jgi:hypothetical protein
MSNKDQEYIAIKGGQGGGGRETTTRLRARLEPHFLNKSHVLLDACSFQAFHNTTDIRYHAALNYRKGLTSARTCRGIQAGIGWQL